MLTKTLQYFKAATVITILIAVSGCATTSSKSPSEKRAAVQKMRQDVLSEIYSEKPDVQSQVANAPGYAVFSNVNVNLLLASFGGGYGVVRDNQSGRDTYMNMGEVGVGLGAGVKDFRALMVFHSRDALNYFVEKGWASGAQADAAAKTSDKGGAVAGEAIVSSNISVYQLTKSGLALQATIKGTKFWKNHELTE